MIIACEYCAYRCRCVCTTLRTRPCRSCPRCRGTSPSPPPPGSCSQAAAGCGAARTPSLQTGRRSALSGRIYVHISIYHSSRCSSVPYLQHVDTISSTRHIKVWFYLFYQKFFLLFSPSLNPRGKGRRSRSTTLQSSWQWHYRNEGN